MDGSIAEAPSVTGGLGIRQFVCLLAIVAFSATAGCGNDSSGGNGTCKPGQAAICTCAAGRSGTQTCQANSTYSACVCSVTPLCVPDASSTCVCSDGRAGSQSCGADQTLGTCFCSGSSSTDIECRPGESASCACPDGTMAAQVCGSDRAFQPCACAKGDGGLDAPLVTTPDGGTTVVALETVLDNPDPGDAGAVSSHVNHGTFWQPAATLPSTFYWDAYLAPRTPGTLVTDGFGANHQFLWETKASSDGSQLIFQGSVYDGTSRPFTAAEGPAPGEWGYHAVSLATKPGLGQPYVFTYWNGIAVGVSLFGPGQRRTVPSAGSGEGNLYVMGATTARTLGGRIAALRAWDRSNPLGTTLDPHWSFVPERSFSTTDGSNVVDLLIEYVVGGAQVPDLAPIGYSGGGSGAPRLHPGVLSTISADQPHVNVGPGPSWVSDARSPYGKVGDLPDSAQPPRTRGAVPARALVFDSFARPHQTFAFQSTPSLGITEGGSRGPQIWNTGTLIRPVMASAFGLLNGRAVFLERQPSIAWVDSGTSEQDIRLTRFTGPGQVGATGIAFRVIDKINWWYAVLVGQPPGFPYVSELRVGHYLNKVHNTIAVYPSPAGDWRTLRVTAVGNTLTFFVSDQAGSWTTVGTLNSAVLKDATGAGLAGTRQADEATSLWRGDDFTVCPAATGC